MRQLSDKQIAILKIICKANPDGSFVDFNQLIERLGETDAYAHKSPTKEALTFSVRYMVGHGLIEKKDLEKRRGQPRRVLAPTLTGYAEYRELLRS